MTFFKILINCARLKARTVLRELSDITSSVNAKLNTHSYAGLHRMEIGKIRTEIRTLNQWLVMRTSLKCRGGEWSFKNSGSRKILVEFHGSRGLVF